MNPVAGGSVFANFFFCGVGPTGLTVFSSVATHVIIDIFAYVQ